MGADADLEELLRYGRMLGERPRRLGGRTVLEFLAGSLLKVRGRDGVTAPLKANRAQREFELRRGQKNVVLKARQMGISTWVSARLFLKAATIPGTLSLQVAHTQEAAEAIFGMAHRFLQTLPAFLREGALQTSRVNAREIHFRRLDSLFRVETAGDPNAGRGLTVTNLHCSELARWPGDAAAVLQGLRAALVPGGELVLESTPQGAQGCFYEQWRRADETGTVRHFFPWWWEALYVGEPAADFTEEERALAAEHGLSPEQIGYRRGLRAEYQGLAAQEFAEDAESCFKASGECIFDTAAIDRRMLTLPRPLEVRENGRLQIWLPAQERKRYLVAVDPAGGGADGDWSVAEVLEMETGLQCAELRAKLPPYEMAMAAAELHRAYNGAWVAVERNNHGAGVLAHLPRLMDERRIHGEGGQMGWLTSSVSRPRMLAGLGALLRTRPELFQSAELLRECRGFVRLANGRTGAVSGEHDDCVMAMALGHAVREILGGRGRGRG